MSEWEIVHGDCIEVMRRLPDKSIDVLITDPPYDDHTHKAGRRGCTGYKEPTRPNATKAQFNRARDLEFEPMTFKLMDEFAEECVRVVKRWNLVFCAQEMLGSSTEDLRKAHLAGWTVGWRTAFERAGQEYIRAQSWYPRGGAPQFTGDRPGRGCELIATFHPKGRKKWNGGGHHGFYDFPIVLNRGKKTERLHTAQKPLELMRELVRRFSNPGEVVLDAFAGSGTTGHACLLEGRSFLGIEKQEKYVEVARARLSNVVVERGADAISVGG